MELDKWQKVRKKPVFTLVAITAVFTFLIASSKFSSSSRPPFSFFKIPSEKKITDWSKLSVSISVRFSISCKVLLILARLSFCRSASVGKWEKGKGGGGERYQPQPWNPGAGNSCFILDQAPRRGKAWKSDAFCWSRRDPKQLIFKMITICTSCPVSQEHKGWARSGRSKC